MARSLPSLPSSLHNKPPHTPLSLSAISPSPKGFCTGDTSCTMQTYSLVAKSLELKHGGLCLPVCPGMQERVWLSVLLIPAWHQPRPSSATGHLSILTGQLSPTHRNMLQEDQLGFNAQYVGLRDSLVPLTSMYACGKGMACITFLPSKGLIS